MKYKFMIEGQLDTARIGVIFLDKENYSYAFLVNKNVESVVAEIRLQRELATTLRLEDKNPYVKLYFDTNMSYYDIVNRLDKEENNINYSKVLNIAKDCTVRHIEIIS